MGESEQGTTLGIIDRLARLEGMLIILQTSIGQSQQQWASCQDKVEILDKRLIQLEIGQVTREDLRELTKKVDTVISRNDKAFGSTSALSWLVKNAAPWIAVLLSLAALQQSTTGRQAGENRVPVQERPYRHQSVAE